MMSQAKRYERITLKRGAASNYTGATRFYLEVTGESDAFLRGYEVDKGGERIWSAKFDERLRLIDKTIIQSRTPQVMNNFYAMLEAAGGSEPPGVGSVAA